MGQGQKSYKFGSIKYNDDNINTSLSLLEDAKKELNNTEAALAKGFQTLGNARGSNWIDYQQNESIITGFPEEFKGYINELSNSLKNKRDEIEDYRDPKNWGKRIFATFFMGVSKFTEGILTVGENIVDAGVSLVGFAAGLFGNKDLQNSCAEFVKVNAMADTFNWINDKTGINKYSIMSPESTGAKLFKMGGTVAGYIIAGAATGGTTAANTTVAAVAGLGAGTESGLMQGKDFNAAFGQGVRQAAIQGVTAYAAGKIGEKLQQNAGAKEVQRIKAEEGEFQNIYSEDIAQQFAEKNAKTIYNNNITNSIANKSASATNKIVHTPGVEKVVEKAGGVIEYGKEVASATGNLGKAIVSPVTKSGLGQAVGGKVTAAVTGAKGLGNTIVSKVASNAVVGQVASATLATAPEAVFSVKNEGNITEKRLEEKKKLISDETKAKIEKYNDIDLFNDELEKDDNSSSKNDNNNTKDVPSFDMEDNSSTGNTGRSSSGGGNYSGGGSNSTPTVAYRQVNDNTTPTETPTKVTETEKVTPEKIDTTPKETTPSTKPNPIDSTPKTENPAPADKPSFENDNLKQTPQTQSYDPGTIGGGSSSYNNGGYTYSSGESSYGDYSTEDPIDVATVATETNEENIMGDSSVGLGNLASSITNTQSYKNQTIKIPTTTGTVEEASTNVAIPTAAALSAAAAAGIGAKAYMDYKENHKENDDEEESFEDGEENNGLYTEEWNGSEDDMKIDYGNEEEATLDDDDDYKYSANSIIEKYEDGNNLDLEEA